MTWQTFYSYAHEDAELRDRLAVYLAPLRRKGKIVEWHDRRIEPGTDWDDEISNQLDTANLVLLLLSPDFLASDYCFGVEVERCLARLKGGSLRVIPVLLRPCLWEDSPFSEMQIIPRNAKPLSSAASPEEAWKEVALEISKLVSEPPPSVSPTSSTNTASAGNLADSSLNLMRAQVRSYARLYERTRQRMDPGSERTQRMAEVFHRMRAMALGCYPLLPELATSPSPGERLAAVAILHIIASPDYLPFLVKTVGSDKPFVGYHAVQALHFAVSALEPASYPALVAALAEARAALHSANVNADADRWTVLEQAENELRKTMSSLAVPDARTRPDT